MRVHRPLPRPLYGCAEEACAENQSWPEDDLFWVSKPTWYHDVVGDDGWYCVECIEGMDHGLEGGGTNVGCSLAHELREMS